MEDVTNAGPGRPRLTARRRPGRTARAEILDAAAELFTTRGFAGTSTRHIAESVGMRQASLYNHFATKDDILAALLTDTVTTALTFAEHLARIPAGRAGAGHCSHEPLVKLYALAYLDSAQLIAERWNLGALYLLPELRGDRFSTFRADRERLREQYRILAVESLTAMSRPPSEQLADLPFRLVESVISTRADTADGASLPEASTIAASALRVLGWNHDPARIHALAVELVENAQTPTLSEAT